MVRTRATYFGGPGEVSVKELDFEPAENQVLVKMHQASICGTDKLLFKGEIPPGEKLPIFPWGHEGGGTVAEVGSRVREFSVGDKVMAFGPRGTYADYCLFDVPYGCLPAPEGVDMETACLGEPLSCAVYASQVLTRQLQVGDVAAVVGVGFAGQIISQGAKKGGADKVIAIDLVDEKLRLAKRLGADIAINAREENPIKVVMEATDGRGVDVVMEASGYGEGLNTASAIVRHNGTIVIYSHYMRPFMVNMHRWHEDALNIINACLMHRTKEEVVVGVRKAFRLVEKGMFEVKPLLTRNYPLSKIEEAFEMEVSDPSSVKPLITP